MCTGKLLTDDFSLELDDAKNAERKKERKQERREGRINVFPNFLTPPPPLLHDKNVRYGPSEGSRYVVINMKARAGAL